MFCTLKHNAKYEIEFAQVRRSKMKSFEEGFTVANKI